MKKIRYAVVGLGHIAQTAVLPAFKNASKNSELVALVSGDETKLRVLGQKYHVKNLFTYDQYDQCLRSGLIDAVYIATPNVYHRIFAQRAANCGIHVLTEKPMAVDEYGCLSMMRAAKENNVKLMVGYRLHFDPANLSAIDMVKKGHIGMPRIFNSSFTMQVKDIQNIRLKEDLGGGPLFDIGIYCINASRYLFQDEPVEAYAMAVTGEDPRFREVDEMLAITLRFPKARLANFTISFGAQSMATYDLIGSIGRIHLDNAYEYADTMELTLTTDEKVQKKQFTRHDQFAPELQYFSNCILEDQDPEPSAEEGLLDIKIITALMTSARINKSVPLDYYRKSTPPRNSATDPQTVSSKTQDHSRQQPQRRLKQTMCIFEDLKKDHLQIKQIVNHLSAFEGAPESKSQILAQLNDAMLSHSRSEEIIFFGALQTADHSEQLIEDCYRQHIEAETLLRMLQACPHLDEEWRNIADNLKQLLENNIENEEKSLFKIAKIYFSDKESWMMGEAFEKLKSQILARGFSKEALDIVLYMMPSRLIQASELQHHHR